MAQYKDQTPNGGDLTAVWNYLNQLNGQLKFILSNLGSGNFNDSVWETLTAASSAEDVGALSGDTEITDLPGVLTVPNGGTGNEKLTKNRILYGAGTDPVNSLAFPAEADSALMQGTSGAPFWDQTPTLLDDFYIATSTAAQDVGTTMIAPAFGGAWWVRNDHGLYIPQSNGIKVSKAGLYRMRAFVALGSAVDVTIMPMKNDVFYNFSQTFTSVAYVTADLLLDASANDVVGFGISTSSTRTINAGLFDLQFLIQAMTL